MTHTVEWLDSGREPECEPNPDYPEGKVIGIPPAGAEGSPVCVVDLPYPAKRIGAYIVTCSKCGWRVAITTAGRVDDPKRLILECRETMH